MEVRYCEVDQVQVGKRLRSLDAKKVAELAESMAAIGLQQPISVWSDSIETLELVAGRHRLEAARKLGWEDIDCIFVDMDDLDRQLWEIDENLCRAEISKAERAVHTAKREELVRAKSEVTSLQELQQSPKPARRPSKGTTKFIKDTAKKTGRSERSVWEDYKIGRKICPDVMDAIKDTPAANDRSELLSLTFLTFDEQREVLEAVQCGEFSTFFRGRHAYTDIVEYCVGQQVWELISANKLNLSDRAEIAYIGKRATNAGLFPEDLILKVFAVYDGNRAAGIKGAAAEVIKDIRFKEQVTKEYRYCESTEIDIKSRSDLLSPYELFAEFLFDLGLSEEDSKRLKQHIKTCKLGKLGTALRKTERAKGKNRSEPKPTIIDVPEDAILIESPN